MKQSNSKQQAQAGITASLSNLVERVPADLKPWPGNPRTHNDKQLAKLKASIRKFGFTVPPLIDETGTILSGHGRVLAALDLGLEMIPVRIITGLTESQKRAYVIADNKLAQLSGWDANLLKQEFLLLGDSDLEIELTGFSTAEVDLLLDVPDESASTDPDDALPEALPQTPVSRHGDLWLLGNHRLLCGSALLVETLQALMQGDLAQMVVSDPPYNVPINGHVCGGGKVKHREFPMASGEMSPAEFTSFLTEAFTQTHAYSQDGAVHFYFMDWRHLREIQDAALPLFGSPRQLCIWVKDNGGMGSFYRSQHELVGGYRLATSVGGTLTGRGGDFILIDDPIKPDDAMSDKARNSVNEWFSTTLLSRLDDKKASVLILVMQRLHVNDLSGFIEAGGGFHKLSLPAIATQNEEIALGNGSFHLRLEGDSLHPEREDLELLEGIRK